MNFGGGITKFGARVWEIRFLEDLIEIKSYP
jgi:hypothetical protein